MSQATGFAPTAWPTARLAPGLPIAAASVAVARRPARTEIEQCLPHLDLEVRAHGREHDAASALAEDLARDARDGRVVPRERRARPAALEFAPGRAPRCRRRTRGRRGRVSEVAARTRPNGESAKPYAQPHARAARLVFAGRHGVELHEQIVQASAAGKSRRPRRPSARNRDRRVRAWRPRAKASAGSASAKARPSAGIRAKNGTPTAPRRGRARRGPAAARGGGRCGQMTFSMRR